MRVRERAPDRTSWRRSPTRGVLAGTIDVDTVRFVTHKDVDDADLDRAVAALDDIARRRTAAAPILTGRYPRTQCRRATFPRARSRSTHIPDDAEIAAGGTLAKWAAAGAAVWVLVTARGEKGTDDPDADLDALAALRVEETAKAAALLGLAGHFHLGYDDGELPDDRELRGAIVRYVRELRPEVVLCPDPTAVFFGDGYFNHHDHRVTGWATLDAVAPAAGNPHYFPEHLREGLAVHQIRAVYLSGTLEPNTWVDIGAHARTQDRRLVLPREPAGRGRRVVPPVPARPRRAGGRRRRGHALRRGVPPHHPHELTLVPRRTDADQRLWRFHSDIARSTSTATMPTPAAPITAPTNVPEQPGARRSRNPRRRRRSR